MQWEWYPTGESSSGLRSERSRYSAQVQCVQISVFHLCVFVCSAATAPLRGRAERCARVGHRRAALRCGYRIAFRVPRGPYRLSAIRPGPRAVRSSRREIPRGAAGAFSQGRALAATAMDSHRLKQFLAERGLLDLLKDFEAYCPPQPRSTQPRPRERSNSTPIKSPLSGQLPLARLRALPPPPRFRRRAGKTVQPTKATAPRSHSTRRTKSSPAPANPNVHRPFIHDRDAGPKSKQCDSKGIVILNGRNSIKGLTSLYNRCDGSLTAPESSDLVLVTANTGIDQETKRSFFYCIKRYAPLSGESGATSQEKAFLDNALIVKCMDIRPKLFPTRAA
ncbi:hypothetical protein EVAR_91791_1 [Eumeta japonica]|uniref:Uncharacterized protein n=1 Tax=Eumeta variegata TaxID=151549 RepID=A0A4C1TA45_EUMVA|nr:hypothetical protein EVAR_91791_1 [Eumeta japonica]